MDTVVDTAAEDADAVAVAAADVESSFPVGSCAAIGLRTCCGCPSGACGLGRWLPVACCLGSVMTLIPRQAVLGNLALQGSVQ